MPPSIPLRAGKRLLCSSFGGSDFPVIDLDPEALAGLNVEKELVVHLDRIYCIKPDTVQIHLPITACFDSTAYQCYHILEDSILRNIIKRLK